MRITLPRGLDDGGLPLPEAGNSRTCDHRYKPILAAPLLTKITTGGPSRLRCEAPASSIFHLAAGIKAVDGTSKNLHELRMRFQVEIAGLFVATFAKMLSPDV